MNMHPQGRVFLSQHLILVVRVLRCLSLVQLPATESLSATLFLSQFCLCFLSLWSCSQPKIHRISKNKPRSSKIIQDHFFSDTNRLRSFMFFIHFHSSITSTFKQAHWNQAGFVRSWDVVPWPSKEGSLHMVMSDTPHIEAEPTGLCHGQMSAHEVTP